MHSIVSGNMFMGTLEQALLETLAYSDVFEYPLRLDEIHCYLPIGAGIEQVAQTLNLLRDQVGERDGFHFLLGHEEIIDIRRHRDAYSRKLLPYALKYGRILGSLSFVRMVALTGSLAVMNSSDGADFDYMLVAAPGRVWTARAFALLFNRFTRLFGHTICPNLIVSELSLRWHQQDLYSARELCQMVPITGMDVYQTLWKVNEWIKDFQPNANQASQVFKTPEISLQKFLEYPLCGKLGDSFEKWEMNRKITRFSKQPGFGEETIFNVEICQGNFDHHRKRTQKKFEKRLNMLRTDSQLPAGNPFNGEKGPTVKAV